MTREEIDELRRALYNAKFTTDADDENPFVGIYFQDLLGIIANYDNNPHWISVEDELPTIPEKWYCVEVLFRTKDSANHLGKYFGDDDKWISYEDYIFKTNDISHWMPVVPPRKDE